MMDAKVLDKYNQLQADSSKDFRLNKYNELIVSVMAYQDKEKTTDYDTVKKQIADIIRRHFPAALDAELLAAAEGRMAMGWEEKDVYMMTANGNRAGRLAVEMSQPEILAVLQRSKEARVAAFERYRTLVAQGVALPPSE